MGEWADASRVLHREAQRVHRAHRVYFFSYTKNFSLAKSRFPPLVSDSLASHVLIV